MNSEKKQKIINLLTICIKAGKTVKGFDSVCSAIKENTVRCVMTASDISDKTLKEISFVCGKYNIPIVAAELTKEEFALYTGKQTAVFAVCDTGFADGFLKIADDYT